MTWGDWNNWNKMKAMLADLEEHRSLSDQDVRAILLILIRDFIERGQD